MTSLSTIRANVHLGRDSYSWDSTYVCAGYYDPGTGRFISEDPIGFLGLDANLYGYVGNDPVGFVDPFGLLRDRPQADPLQQIGGTVGIGAIFQGAASATIAPEGQKIKAGISGAIGGAFLGLGAGIGFAFNAPITGAILGAAADFTTASQTISGAEPTDFVGPPKPPSCP